MGTDVDLTPYEVAYLCGGPARVAMVALVGLHADGQIRVSSDRCRVYVVRSSARDDVESAVFEIVPDVGRVLGLTVAMVAASAPVKDIARGLRAKRLISGSRLSALWQPGRAWRARGLRRSWRTAPDAGPAQVAVMGAAGIADDELRRIFETHKYRAAALGEAHQPTQERPAGSVQHGGAGSIGRSSHFGPDRRHPLSPRRANRRQSAEALAVAYR